MSGSRRKDRRSVRDLLPPDVFVQRIDCTTREDAIAELLNRIVVEALLPMEREQATREAILQREQVASTGIGNGVAIPHAKSKFAERFAVSVGLSEEGVDFGAHDGRPARVIFLWICPPAATREHLALMRALASVARDPRHAAELARVRDRRGLLEVLGRIPVEGR